MLYGYPTPISIAADEGGLVVHRSIEGAHEDGRTCWCCPHCFVGEALEDLTADKLNLILRSELQ